MAPMKVARALASPRASKISSTRSRRASTEMSRSMRSEAWKRRCSSTVTSAMNWSSWSKKATRRLCSATSKGAPLKLTAPDSLSPPSKGIRRPKVLRSTLLPDPLAPMMATNSPGEAKPERPPRSCLDESAAAPPTTGAPLPLTCTVSPRSLQVSSMGTSVRLFFTSRLPPASSRSPPAFAAFVAESVSGWPRRVLPPPRGPMASSVASSGGGPPPKAEVGGRHLLSRIRNPETLKRAHQAAMTSQHTHPGRPMP
mmetsp:Transcript_31533/g.70860  ORF Transcript_31533/g.70860 Transcript_31533/m.70860 type:complete len:255 (-) Transcript_31533:998-1762(-)